MQVGEQHRPRESLAHDDAPRCETGLASAGNPRSTSALSRAWAATPRRSRLYRARNAVTTWTWPPVQTRPGGGELGCTLSEPDRHVIAAGQDGPLFDAIVITLNVALLQATPRRRRFVLQRRGRSATSPRRPFQT